MRAALKWLAIAAAAAVVAAVDLGQRHANARLRSSVELRRHQLHAALTSRREAPPNPPPAPPPAVFIDKKQVDAIVIRKRRDVAELRQRWQQLETLAAPEQPTDPGRFPVGVPVPASAWTDAGNATPAAAFEMALWSAAGGDVARLSQLLVFPDEQTKAAAQSLYDALPESDRERYGSPERAIAALTITSVPIGSVVVKEWGDVQGRSVTFVRVKLMGGDGATRGVIIPFEAQPGGWKLLVTRATVARFAAQLKQSPIANPAPN